MTRRYGGRVVTVLPDNGAVWAKTSRMNTMVHMASSLAAGMIWADERYGA
ncbi:hypothetical protein [Streptomyces sp. NBC_01500]|nr:hypothetical protein [Streptomyces sp. NBC_01500]MCX4554161.1 hypothetical protein [Streptomyces sp. NBC_01500]